MAYLRCTSEDFENLESIKLDKSSDSSQGKCLDDVEDVQEELLQEETKSNLIRNSRNSQERLVNVSVLGDKEDLQGILEEAIDHFSNPLEKVTIQAIPKDDNEELRQLREQNEELSRQNEELMRQLEVREQYDDDVDKLRLALQDTQIRLMQEQEMKQKARDDMESLLMEFHS